MEKPLLTFPYNAFIAWIAWKMLKKFDLCGYTSAIVDMGSIPPVAGVRPWGPLFQRTQNPISFYRDGSMRLK